MTRKEKLLLLNLLMIDIRQGWDLTITKKIKDPRIWECKKIIQGFHTASYLNLDWFPFFQSFGVYVFGDYEGRYLRMPFADGGYEGMELIHKLSLKTFTKRSTEFRTRLNELTRYVGKD